MNLIKSQSSVTMLFQILGIRITNFLFRGKIKFFPQIIASQ